MFKFEVDDEVVDGDDDVQMEKNVWLKLVFAFDRTNK